VIDLEPVDSVIVTTLMGNVTDIFMPRHCILLEQLPIHAPGTSADSQDSLAVLFVSGCRDHLVLLTGPWPGHWQVPRPDLRQTRAGASSVISS
jgi:hypothetical protein